MLTKSESVVLLHLLERLRENTDAESKQLLCNQIVSGRSFRIQYEGKVSMGW